MPKKRVYLKVPFSQKDEVKRLGAMWDSEKNLWFAPKHLDILLFSKWLNEPQTKFNFNQNEVLGEFKKALEANGLIIENEPIMDGKIHRVSVLGDKGRELSGAYKGFLDEYPAGFIQNFKTGFKQNWKFQSRNTNFSGKLTTKNMQEPIKQTQKEQNLLELQEKTAQKLELEYKNAKPADPKHPYLIKKGIQNTYHLKQDEYKALLIPLQDTKGKIWAVQRIFSNGDKIIGVIKSKAEKEQGVEYAAKKSGCFSIIGAENLNQMNEFIIAEGFATAATLNEALQKPIIMGVDSGNLIKIVENLKNEYPNITITIAADNDKRREFEGSVNVGAKVAEEIKQKYPQTKLIIPKINNEEAKLGISDFNDIYLKKGIEAVISQFKEFFSISQNSNKETKISKRDKDFQR